MKTLPEINEENKNRPLTKIHEWKRNGYVTKEYYQGFLDALIQVEKLRDLQVAEWKEVTQ